MNRVQKPTRATEDRLLKKIGLPGSRADQKRLKRRRCIGHWGKISRLRRRLLFVIRWSNFDSYWDVVDVLEGLTFEYRQMLGDAEEIIQWHHELVENLAKETRQ